MPGTIATSDVSIRGGGGAGNPALSSMLRRRSSPWKLGMTAAAAHGSSVAVLMPRSWVTFARAAGIAPRYSRWCVQHHCHGADAPDTAGFQHRAPSVTTSHAAGPVSTKLVVTGLTITRRPGYHSGGYRDTATPPTCADVSPGSATTVETFADIAVKSDGSFSAPIKIAVGTDAEQPSAMFGNCVLCPSRG